MDSKTMDKCIFCEKFDPNRIIYENSTWVAVLDAYPVTNGHTLLIPKRHCADFFDLNHIECGSLIPTIDAVKSILDTKFHPSGYNIGVNCGKSAGQTIMHCHIHIIPRHEGDVENPMGGVRGVIPSKQSY